MSTNTRTNTKAATKKAAPASPLDAAESAALALAEENREKSLSAREGAAERQAEADDAEAALESLLSAFASGDASRSALDLATARAEAERTTLLATAADAVVKRYKKGAEANTDKRVAVAVADAIRPALRGFSVTGTFATVTPDMAEVPAVYVMQEKAGELHNGTLGAHLTIVMYRSPLHRPLDEHVIGNALNAAGIQYRSSGLTHIESRRQEDAEIDRLRIEVGGVLIEGLPLVGAALADGMYTRAVGGAFASAVANGIGRIEKRPVRQSIGNGKFTIGATEVWSTTEVKSCATDSNGVRVAELRVGLNISTRNGYVASSVMEQVHSTNEVNAIMEKYAEGLAGAVYPSVGIVKDVTRNGTQGWTVTLHGRTSI